MWYIVKSEKFASAKNSGKIAKSSPNWETSLDVRSLRCSELSPHSAPALRRASEGAGVLGPPPQRQVLVPPNKPHLLDKLPQPLVKQLQQQLVVFLVRIFEKLLQVQVILFEMDSAIFYTTLHELFCQLIRSTIRVNSGKFMDNSMSNYGSYEKSLLRSHNH